MRGEQLTAPPRWAKRLGSPPLARGTDFSFCAERCEYRITPACAGNRRRTVTGLTLSRDHPRLRGEQNYYSSDINWKQGSPPLARGTGLATGETDFIRRITPACAGNRLGFGIAGTAIRDHPRLRGEQNLHGRKSQIRLGSPPLARGTAYGRY